MISHLTHGNSVGGAVDYLTKEVAEKQKNTPVQSAAESSLPVAAEPSLPAVTEAPKDSNRGLLNGDEILRGRTADGHSQYPRAGYPDDLDEDYRPNRRWRIIGGDLSDDPKVAVELLAKVIALRPDIENPVWHASLSAHPDDKITTEQWRAIARRFLDEMGFKDVPFLIVQHRDQEQDHIHIVTSRVDVFGNVNDAWRERYRAQLACVKIEQEFELKRAPREKAERAEKIKQTFSKDGARFQLQEKIEAVLNSMETPNVAEFVGKLEADQVLVGAKFSPAGEVFGLSFAVPGKEDRHVYLERKQREEAREQKEQEKLLRSIEKTNAQSGSSLQLTLRKEQPESEQPTIISFKAGKLGGKYSWENLKSQLNYAPQDKPILEAASARAERKEFQSAKQNEIKKPETPVVEVLDPLKQEPKPEENKKESEPTVPFPETADKKSFWSRVRAYLPPKAVDFILPPVESPEKAAAGLPPPSNAPLPPLTNAESPAPVPQKAAESVKADEKPLPTISAFDLALEKQLMAAEISQAFQKISDQGFLLAGNEIVQLNLDLRAASIYSEFFFDGQTVTGIRFSKPHRETGEVITFKGSELNVPTLRWQKAERLAIKNETASPINLFSDRHLPSEIREKITDLNGEFGQAGEGLKKVDRTVVFQANIIDAKANEVFANYFNNATLSAKELKDEDIIILNRIKRYFLEKEATKITPAQTETISQLHKEVVVKRDVALVKVRQSNFEVENDADLLPIFNYRNDEKLFSQSLKTGLDADLLISNALPKDERDGSASRYFKVQTRDYWREQPMPPIPEQMNDYFGALDSRLDNLGVNVSPLFISLLNEDLNSMSEINFLKPKPKSTDLNDFFIPDGVEFIKTVESIKKRGEWEKYSDQEALENKLKAALFVLANGNEKEKYSLLDQHISSVEEREQEIMLVGRQELVEESIRNQKSVDRGLEI